MEPFQPSLGTIADTGTRVGLGVFASRDIAAGEIVEVAPVVRVHANYLELPDDLQLRVFNWRTLAGEPGVLAVALGYGSLYNHANPANTRYRACRSGAAIAFVAARAIAQAEEITLNYNDVGGDISSQEDGWFEQNGVTPYRADGGTG